VSSHSSDAEKQGGPEVKSSGSRRTRAATARGRVEDFDLTKMGPKERAAGSDLLVPEDRDYDPTEDREWARSAIALTLVGVLAGIVILAFAYVLISLFLLKAFRDMEALKTLLQILFTPVVGLVGAATGFYFGEKSGRSK
jgi:hypothetical protein